MTTDVVPILRVSDAAVAVEWYLRLGFQRVFEHRFEPHFPAYVGIRRDDAQIHLSEHVGDANPHGLVYFWVDDADAVAAEFGVSVDEQPWARGVALTDPDGNRLRVAEPVGAAGADELVGEGATEVLIELERVMWNDSTRGDRAWIDNHLTGSFTEFGWSGATYTRQEILDLDVGHVEATLEQFAVCPLGRDAALVTYRSNQQQGSGNRSLGPSRRPLAPRFPPRDPGALTGPLRHQSAPGITFHLDRLNRFVADPLAGRRGPVAEQIAIEGVAEQFDGPYSVESAEFDCVDPPGGGVEGRCEQFAFGVASWPRRHPWTLPGEPVQRCMLDVDCPDCWPLGGIRRRHMRDEPFDRSILAEVVHELH
jgi:catechol 2,3-dioxygenase-like lactoylglutathione lyase family enzyme